MGNFSEKVFFLLFLKTRARRVRGLGGEGAVKGMKERGGCRKESKEGVRESGRGGWGGEGGEMDEGRGRGR